MDTNSEFIAFEDSDEDQENSVVVNLESNESVAADQGQTRGKKRKHDETEESVRSSPWTQNSDYSLEGEVSTWLHREILDLTEYLSLDGKATAVRGEVVAKIQKTVKRLWSDATVCVFGSFATNLCLPESDIDMVIIFASGKYGDKSRLLYQLANAIKTAGIATKVEVIARARVPIIKFVDSTSGVSIDISFETYSGVVAADTIMHWLADTPGLRELVLVVKYFVAKRAMNNVALGGLGGFAIVCMVLSFLQMHPKVASGDILADKNLGVLLIQFFELYGKHFNYDSVGISVVGSGKYFRKNTSFLQNTRSRYGIYIEDPNDSANNITRGTYNLAGIRRIFSGAYDLLTSTCYEMDALSRKKWKNRSLLASLLGFK
ncbi:uncharacterized protein V1516DRAFT_677598 [Lipomyces oligophaga]|uniref:uncharacterized protein n=1 Tax=Lipomyces oligophaga TaxID=45792 RepID=UPI0034CDFAC0